MPVSDSIKKGCVLYCAAWPLPWPLPLPRTGMVAPVLFMMKLNSSSGVMSFLVAISIKMLSGYGSPLKSASRIFCRIRSLSSPRKALNCFRELVSAWPKGGSPYLRA